MRITTSLFNTFTPHATVTLVGVKNHLKPDTLTLTVVCPDNITHAVRIPKGFFTIARRQSTETQLAQTDAFVLTHCIVNTESVLQLTQVSNDTVVLHAVVHDRHYEYRTEHGFHVFGIKKIAVHLQKKANRLPRTVLAYTVIPAYQDLHTALSVIERMRLYHPEESLCASVAEPDTLITNAFMPDIYCELYHFNCALISRIASSYPQYTLRQCRGVCLNTCLALNAENVENVENAEKCSVDNDSHIVMAHTLQRMHVDPRVMSSIRELSAHKEECHAQFRSQHTVEKQIHGVFAVPAHTLAQWRSLNVHLKQDSPVFVAYSPGSIPVVIGELTQQVEPQPPSSIFFADTMESALDRLRFIQATCDSHCLPRHFCVDVSRAWATSETQKHPQFKNPIKELARIRTPALFGHSSLSYTPLMASGGKSK